MLNESGAVWAELTDQIVAEVAGLTEDLRQARLLQHLRELTARDIVEVLNEIVVRAKAREPSCQQLMLVLVNLNRYQEELGYDRIADIYVLADQRGYDDVKRLVATSEAKQVLENRDGPENEYLEMTLGERKALARVTRNRDELDRLLYDRNPQVIGRVLVNPSVTERDVIKVASMRPTTGEVLGEIVNNRKWISRYRVKKTVVCNPYTPINIALSLLGYMLKQDLREISENTTLSEEVREMARRRAQEGRNDLDA